MSSPLVLFYNKVQKIMNILFGSKAQELLDNFVAIVGVITGAIAVFILSVIASIAYAFLSFDFAVEAVVTRGCDFVIGAGISEAIGVVGFGCISPLELSLLELLESPFSGAISPLEQHY
ncbi:hypothetical protein C2G38_2218098 [Gigaspora rosea]|uniref:Uncharacterized protein n=1 Tax=Gigaspora rosea TaxID=44941 RepID=A0A397U713_9GLOM|nr:hypothetical protein C2G38_2218098 [Gigaspora rosea]